MASSGNETDVLKRQLGVWGAVMLGLGSIVGKGVFVSIGIGAGIVGAGVVVAIGVAALLWQPAMGCRARNWRQAIL
jgi:APA family basic amino acid/polyamine antiporter